MIIKRLLDKLNRKVDPTYDTGRLARLAADVNALDLSGLSREGMRAELAGMRADPPWDAQGAPDRAADPGDRGVGPRKAMGAAERRAMVRTFAMVKEAVRRTMGVSIFDVQLMAAVALCEGTLIEMQTGEGKTYSAVFPAAYMSLAGKGVHVLTFNDYLARRDCRWMGPIYDYLGVSAGYVSEAMGKDERLQMYARDVTYLTAKEAGFDFLRDFAATDRDGVVQRPLYYAIVDEADSIMIDEARVPLIISGSFGEGGLAPSRGDAQPDVGGGPTPGHGMAWAVRSAKALTDALRTGQDYGKDASKQNAYLTDEGVRKAEAHFGCGNLFTSGNVHLLTAVNNALHAKALLRRDVDYVVRDGKVDIVDEFTGRRADRKHWHDGLQWAVEEKEGVFRGEAGKVLGQVTMQFFLGEYPRLSGMTGTVIASVEEFKSFYELDTVVIPPNRPCVRVDAPDVVYSHREPKLRAIVEDVANAHRSGRPVLVGTASIAESERIARMIAERRLPCTVLNAKNDEEEAEVVAKAGMLGAVTISTNMAGRGTDIKLGGERGEMAEEIRALGGLYVIGTNRHESMRVDYQLRGRSGRQGDPGETRFYISLEDPLIVKYKIGELLPQHLACVRSDLPLPDSEVNEVIGHGQRMVEGQLFGIRQNLNKYSLLLERQRKAVHRLKRSLLVGSGNPGVVDSFFRKAGEELDRLSSMGYVEDDDGPDDRYVTSMNVRGKGHAASGRPGDGLGADRPDGLGAESDCGDVGDPDFAGGDPDGPYGDGDLSDLYGSELAMKAEADSMNARANVRVTGRARLDELSELVRERRAAFGEGTSHLLERRIAIAHLGETWSRFIERAEDIRQGIHLLHAGGKNPLEEFNKEILAIYEGMMMDFLRDVTVGLTKAAPARPGPDGREGAVGGGGGDPLSSVALPEDTPKGPTSTWTYIVGDNADQLGMNPIARDPIAALLNAPLYFTASLFGKKGGSHIK
ncbi:MAG: hypothetical protein FWE70_06215 [Oscillospiraceae bacterium]|nr:hypothetical protein [Oscillospiraceae bacterium]